MNFFLGRTVSSDTSSEDEEENFGDEDPKPKR